MDTFRLSLQYGNAPSADDLHAEVARTLREVAWRVARGHLSGDIRDVSGNVVGTFALDTQPLDDFESLDGDLLREPGDDDPLPASS